MRVWSVKTCECQLVIGGLAGMSTSAAAGSASASASGSGAAAASANANVEVNVHSVHLVPRTPEQFLVCSRSNSLCLVNMQGQVFYDLNIPET